MCCKPKTILHSHPIVVCCGLDKGNVVAEQAPGTVSDDPRNVSVRSQMPEMRVVPVWLGNLSTDLIIRS